MDYDERDRREEREETDGSPAPPDSGQVDATERTSTPESPDQGEPSPPAPSEAWTEPEPALVEPDAAPTELPAEAPTEESGESPASAEIESWPSQEASITTQPPEPAPEPPGWPTEPPAAGSADPDAWPTAAPERGEEPIEPEWPSAPAEPMPAAAEGPPSEVEAYPTAASADSSMEAGAATAAGSLAAHAVPAGESAAGESTKCPRCGTENRPGLAFCRNCGQRLVAAGVASTVERPGTPEGTMACPRCGTHNRAGVAFCQNCGANLRGAAPGYVPPAVAPEEGARVVEVGRRRAILGPVVLLIGLVGLVTGYLLPFAYGSGSLLDRAIGPDGYSAAFWAGYPDVGAALADQAYFGLAAPLPLLGLLLLVLVVAGFVRAAPGWLQTIGLGIALLWSVGLIVVFVVVELAGNWSGDLVGMLRVLTPAGIIFFLSALIVLIGTLTRFGRS